MMPVAAKKTSSPWHEVVGGEHAVEVVAGVEGGLALLVVARIEPALDVAPQALERRRGDDPLGGPADAVEQVDAACRAGRP